MSRLPIQPPVMVGEVLRYRENALVKYLLDNGGIDMNHLACKEFPKEDRIQFAQLIGYSLSGASDLSYFSPKVTSAAYKMHKKGMSDKDAAIEALSEEIDELRSVITSASRILENYADEE